jgi:hypothetical protein
MAQVSATRAIMNLARNSEFASKISAAGAIPLLVQFLDPGDGPPAMMQGIAAGALNSLAANAEDAVAIASAGAIPLLAQLLKAGSPPDVQWNAIGALASLARANAENAVTIASAGAIPPLARLSRSDDVTKAAAAKKGTFCWFSFISVPIWVKSVNYRCSH